MTPGLAFFYGGLVRGKNVGGTIMHSFMAIAVVSVVWVLWGYTLAFGGDVGGAGFIGNGEFFGLRNVTGDPGPYSDTIPHILYMAFQMMFAIITPALIAGAFAERMKFSSFLIFIVAWVTFTYAPLAHWVWGDNGWIGNELGALDFAGGTVVHINAGAAAIAAAIIIGKRRGIHRETVPHDVPMVVLGAALLWFGWFGFNAGSALTSGGDAANAFVTTNTAAAMAALVWVGLGWFHTGKASVVGAATGAVIGLVAITPAAGFVGQWPALDGYGNALPALIIGGFASVLGFYAVRLLSRVRSLDDTLDVFAVHGIGGLWGAFATGIFAVTVIGGAQGAIDGSLDLLWRQLAAMGAALGWSFVTTAIILLAIKHTIGLSISEEAELIGLDRSEHGEPAYQYDEPGGHPLYSGGVSTVVDGPAPPVPQPSGGGD
jgi:Amt family ammonium transporter